MEVTYTLLSNAVVLKVGGDIYNIHKEDPRFIGVEEAIKNKDFSKIVEIVYPGSFLKAEGFSVEGGLVQYRGQPLPMVISNQFKQFRDRGVDFLGLINFWYNLKNRESFKTSQEKLERLLAYNGYPFTQDGFVVIYGNPIFRKEQELKIEDDSEIRFYDYSYADDKIKKLFDQRKSFDEVMTEIFGFESKKLQKMAYENLFPRRDNTLDHTFFNYGLAFKDILTPNNLFTVMEKKLIYLRRGSEDYRNLNKFLKELLKTREVKKDENGVEYNVLSEKRLMNLFKKKYTADEMFGSASLYFEYSKKEGWVADISTMSFSSFGEMYEFMANEAKKFDPTIFELNTLQNYPELQGLENEVVRGMKFIVPTQNKELIAWGQTMANCIGGYGHRVKEKSTLVLALVNADTNEMKYNLEISNYAINQFKGHRNSAGNPTDKQAVIEVLQKYKIVR